MNWQEKLSELHRYVDSNPSLFAFMVRDWEVTEKAGLRDLAWVLARGDSYATRNDAQGLYDYLAEYLKENPS